MLPGEDAADVIVRQVHRIKHLEAENAALRDMLAVLARQIEITLSYSEWAGDEDGEELVAKARALLAAQAQHDELPTTLDQDATFW